MDRNHFSFAQRIIQSLTAPSDNLEVASSGGALVLAAAITPGSIETSTALVPAPDRLVSVDIRELPSRDHLVRVVPDFEQLEFEVEGTQQPCSRKKEKPFTRFVPRIGGRG